MVELKTGDGGGEGNGDDDGGRVCLCVWGGGAQKGEETGEGVPVTGMFFKFDKVRHD